MKTKRFTLHKVALCAGILLSACSSYEDAPTAPSDAPDDTNLITLIEEFQKGNGKSGSITITNIDLKSYSANDLLAQASLMSRTSIDQEVLIHTVSFESNGQDGFAVIGESNNVKQIYYITDNGTIAEAKKNNTPQ